MSSGHCRECRFFDGNICKVRNQKVNPGSFLGCFVPYTGMPGDKHCKTCRFFDGALCSKRGQKVNPGSSLSCHSPF